MSTMKTPGVYIIEKNAFANSVVEAATAIPAFIGYTEKAQDGSTSLWNKPWRISSMSEFHNYFGNAPSPKFTVTSGTDPVKEPPASSSSSSDSTSSSGQTKKAPGKSTHLQLANGESYQISLPANYHTLYYQMVMFFANGGGPCYIVSVGDYEKTPDKGALIEGLSPLLKEQEPTMVVIPEAAHLPIQRDGKGTISDNPCADVQQAMLNHCGIMKNRVAVLDICEGDTLDSQGNIINAFREKVGNYLSYGVAYTPWLCTSVVSEKDLGLNNLNWEEMRTVLTTSKLKQSGDTKFCAMCDMAITYLNQKSPVSSSSSPSTSSDSNSESGSTSSSSAETKWTEEEIKAKEEELHPILMQNWPTYREVMSVIRKQLNLLPPSAAMAGIYTMVDNTRGVWKAPANVSVALTVSPSANITNEMQEDLNVPLNGKAVNAIRSFVGEGIKVWGARTLDGNSLDWRYINVRRTMIFLEESIKNAARAYVFEPNDANTWVNMKSMIGSFLQSVWKRGGLAGSVPDDAYSVHIGLGDTMTPEDILEGILRITVLVAITRPAEFIEITFQQQMQKS